MGRTAEINMDASSATAAKANESGENANKLAEDTNENKKEGCGLMDKIMSLVAAPVAGGFCFKAIYYLLVVFVMIWFLVCLAGISATFNKPITEVTNTFNETLAYPDVYFCVPAFTMAEMMKCSSCDYSIPGMSKSLTGEKCRGWASVNGLRADMDKAFEGCATQLTVSDADIGKSFYTNIKGSSFAEGYDDSKTAWKNIVDPSPFVEDEDTKELAKAMPSSVDEDGTKYTPFCMSFKQDNTSEFSRASYDAKHALMNFQAMKTSEESLKTTMFFQAYFTEQGKTPFTKIGGKNIITATEVLWPGKAQITQATLSVETITDTTSRNAAKPNKIYDSTPTLVYRAVVSGQPMQTSHYDHSENNGAGGFSNPMLLSANIMSFGSFVFREITIRDKTYAEIWAEVGGIWAASSAILIILFVQSGHVKPKDENGTPGKELMVFRWQPSSMKKAALAPYQAKKEASVEDEIAELRKQVAQLQEAFAGSATSQSVQV